MVEKIEKLKKGDIIIPKTLGMENQRSNFYRWLPMIDNVEKIDGSWIKIA